MTVLITGGAGFLGLNIAEQLLTAGASVVSYGLQAPPAWAMDRLGALPGRMAVKIGDVRDRDALVETMREHRVRRVVHGAAITAALGREAQQASLIAAVNFGGTIGVLEAALQCGAERVVQLGSGSVYGASVKQEGSLDEDADVPVPDSLYGITKYAAERAALRYRATRGLDVVVARLGVVFGRWEYDTSVRDTLSIPLVLMQLAEAGGHAAFGRTLPADWVYACDVADAVIRLLNAPSVPQPLYHVGSGQRWSAITWCERLRHIYPFFSYEVVDRPDEANVGRQAPVPRPPFSIKRLQADLGYEVRYREAEAFADYLAWRRDMNRIGAQ
ncbi:NAD-dependent epimerase/dehydratase family protein [Microvirga sp. M2]|uniref:NAD-dependent epimerase/dehydratase family protein n=1 Tax=Microvirga sp. M2 TaxID=3073270 RepID=UPI0039C06A4B